MKTCAIIIRRDCGFFSDFLTALNGMMWAEANGFEPWVDWRNRWYNDGDENLFDRWFHQPAPTRPPDQTFQNVTPAQYFPAIYAGGGRMEPDYFAALQPAADYIRRHGTVDAPKETMPGRLGAYKRGTDHGYHGPILSDDEIVSGIRAEWETGRHLDIFFTSDEQTVVDRVLREFPEAFTSQSFRSPDGRPIHSGGFTPASRGLLALNVLNDALSLAACEHLLLVRSNVSTFALLCAMQRPDFGPGNFRFLDKHVVFRD